MSNSVSSSQVTYDDFLEFLLATEFVEFPLPVEIAGPIKTLFYVFHSKETEHFLVLCLYIAECYT
jgi:hypothetical protein